MSTESVFSSEDQTKMEQEVSNFKSIRAKFQEEILAKSRPVLPEKPRRLPTAPFGRSGLITINSSLTETKTPGLARVIFREDQKVASGKQPVSFPSFPHTMPEDSGNRHLFKVRHVPLVLPISCETKHESAAPSSKGITSPLKYIKKPMPAPFKSTKTSLCGKEIGKNGLEHMKNDNNPNVQTEESIIKAVNAEFVEMHQTLCLSPEHPSSSSPNESLTDSSPSSVTHFFDQHVLSTLEKAKRKLSHKNLLVCGRPKSFYPNKGVASTESPPSHTESESSHPETVCPTLTRCSTNSVPVYASTSPLKVKTSRSAITHMKLNGVTQSERVHSRVRKPLPDLASLGPMPSKPPRPPHVNLSRYKTQGNFTDSSKTHSTECKPETEILTTKNASLENITVPPPEFPDFDIVATETKDSYAINIAALELETTEFPDSDCLPPPPLLDKDSGLHFPATLVQHSPSHAAAKNMWSGEVLCGSLEEPRGEEVLSDLEVNGSHNVFNSEHCFPSEPNSSFQDHFHETCDNVYEDVETIPKFPFSQNSRKRKVAPKNPYADNGHSKEEVRRNMWHVTQWSSSEDQNGQTHDRKEQLSPEHHDEKEQKKKEKQRLEREKKEQKEQEKKRNEMHKKFKITGLEEPMYHARVLVASKLRKHDLPVKSGDVISIIRTVNCPKGKWLARDTNKKYGYISVMNVELNIKEMLELGKRASQAAGRGQTDGDNLSFSSRSSHQNPVLTSSFTDDSEEWTCDDETLSPSADNLGICTVMDVTILKTALYLTMKNHALNINKSQNRAVSMPDMFYSNLSAHHIVSDCNIEDIQTQNEALQKLAVFFQNGHENLLTTTENELSLPNTDDPGFLIAVDEPPYLLLEMKVLQEVLDSDAVEEPSVVSKEPFSQRETADFQFADIDLLPPPALYADSQ